GDSLMPLYRDHSRGYEMVYQPLNGHLRPTHRLADEWNLRNRIYEDAPGTHRHHDEAESIRGAARILDCDRGVFRRFPDVLASFRGRPASHEQRNHKVAGVRDIPGNHDVY